MGFGEAESCQNHYIGIEMDFADFLPGIRKVPLVIDAKVVIGAAAMRRNSDCTYRLCGKYFDQPRLVGWQQIWCHAWSTSQAKQILQIGLPGFQEQAGNLAGEEISRKKMLCGAVESSSQTHHRSRVNCQALGGIKSNQFHNSFSISSLTLSQGFPACSEPYL